ncbi:MAG: MaoC/PaaZ C-terminal domain-containing protein [Acidimicrobiales bacterium]
MPVPSAVVGLRTEPVIHEVDARWTMAHAAVLGDTGPVHLDTTAAAPVVAHPLFPVCVEWPAVTAARLLVDRDLLPRHEAARGVHASHDLVVHRLVRAGDRLTTTAAVVVVERRRPGAHQVLRLDTVDEDGLPVATTWMGSLFLGVEVDGPDRHLDDALPPAPPEPSGDADPAEVGVRCATSIPIDAGLAHTYTECARIWNPIHTDAAVAAAAGLPGIILHGTATLALAVSRVVAVHAGGDPHRVRRVTARLGAMVMPGSAIVVASAGPVASAAGATVAFTARNAEGQPAVRDASVVLGPAS